MTPPIPHTPNSSRTCQDCNRSSCFHSRSAGCQSNSRCAGSTCSGSWAHEQSPLLLKHLLCLPGQVRHRIVSAECGSMLRSWLGKPHHFSQSIGRSLALLQVVCSGSWSAKSVSSQWISRIYDFFATRRIAHALLSVGESTHFWIGFAEAWAKFLGDALR